MLTTELIVAMAILVIAVLPLGYSFVRDARFLRASYQRAVAMEIVDGEMEILVAGEWRALPEGTQPYVIQADAAANLPPGRFEVTRAGRRLRLEWASAEKRGIGTVVREVTLK
ncbi:MAG: type IV pilus modification PilV family protein [Limisphaerales bacterium]